MHLDGQYQKKQKYTLEYTVILLLLHCSINHGVLLFLLVHYVPYITIRYFWNNM